MDIIVSTPTKDEEYTEQWTPFEFKFFRILRYLWVNTIKSEFEYPIDLLDLFTKDYPAPIIHKLQEFLLLEQTTEDDWKQFFIITMKFLDRDIFFWDTTIDMYESKDIINLVENLVGLAVWIMDTFYSKFGTPILIEPYEDQANLVSWYIHFGTKKRRKCQLRIFQLENYLIKASDIKERIKASNRIKDWYIQYYWEPSRVMNRDSNVNKIKNYQGYYYDIDLIEPDIFT